MTAPTFPTTPDPWPLRTQDRDTFNAAAASTFDFYDAMKVWGDAFGPWATGIASALVSANLPSLTGLGHKTLYVNHAGNGVEFDNPAKFAAATAISLGRIGDSDAVTFADGAATTLDLEDGLATTKVHTILLLGFYKFRLNAATTNRNFRVQLVFNGSVQAQSESTGRIDQVANESTHVTNWALVSTTVGGSAIPIAAAAACDDDVHLDRAHVAALAIRAS